MGVVEIGMGVDSARGAAKLSRRSGDGQVGLGTHLWARLISEAVGSTPELRPCGVCIPLSFAVFTTFYIRSSTESIPIFLLLFLSFSFRVRHFPSARSPDLPEAVTYILRIPCTYFASLSVVHLHASLPAVIASHICTPSRHSKL